jgi:hypothetical protein
MGLAGSLLLHQVLVYVFLIEHGRVLSLACARNGWQFADPARLAVGI